MQQKRALTRAVAPQLSTPRRRRGRSEAEQQQLEQPVQPTQPTQAQELGPAHRPLDAQRKSYGSTGPGAGASSRKTFSPQPPYHSFSWVPAELDDEHAENPGDVVHEASSQPGAHHGLFTAALFLRR